jgi:primosomal protein N''
MGDLVMKKLTLLACIALGAAATLAQPPPEHRGPPPHARGPSTLFREKPEPASPVRRWMMELRENNPEEFERLQQMRLENPRAFREAISERLQETALERMREKRPAIYDALMTLSPEERRWALERMSGPGMMHPGEKEKRREPPEPGLRQLAREYREAGSKSERDMIRGQLRDELGRLYDQRLQERREQLDEIRNRLHAMESAITEGEQTRDAFIAEKLDAWLDDGL